MPLSSGKIQEWLFERFGQNLFADFLIAISFQFFGFRKKAYFLQMSSFINVGSFNRVQIIVLTLGSFIGLGLSAFLLICGNLTVGLCLMGIAVACSFFAKEQRKDLSVAILALGFFMVCLFFFNQYFTNSNFSILQIHINEMAVFGGIIISTLLFRTPIPFLITLTILNMFIGIRVEWFPVLFLLNSICTLTLLYRHALGGRKRLHFYFLAVLICQILQYIVSMLIFPFISDWFSGPTSFIESYQTVVICFILYQSMSLVLLAPVAFLLSLLPMFNSESEKITEKQMIYYNSSRGSFYSIHLSLFLMRQEFKKFITSVHTLLKISRETNHEDSPVNQKFIQYQNILERVADELKELCFSIGRQRSYRRQIKEVMGCYRHINQIELLVEDLAQVSALLRKNSYGEDWERECRFWLSLQMMIFESFLNATVGASKDEPSKVNATVDKSFEVLDRFFVVENMDGADRAQYKTFCRITESVRTLAL